MCPQMKLNARQVETVKPRDKTYKMADGGGLYLEVRPRVLNLAHEIPTPLREERGTPRAWPTVMLVQAENSVAYTFETIAREWYASNKRWSDDAIERQLSHSERNNMRAAYIHLSECLDERRLMVQWWADYLDSYRNGQLHHTKSQNYNRSFEV
ncbi:hypothetical protein KLEPA_00112 (plasmid) [Klebsiella pneumoniae]